MASGFELNRYQLDWLASFLAVVQAGSFSGASEVVHRSQPRISAHIAALEVALGAKLFDRSRKPAELTEVGRAVLEHARAIRDQLEAMSADVDDVAEVKRGHLEIGSFPSAAALYLPTLLRAFSTRFPDVEVELKELPTSELDIALVDRRIHLAIRALVPPPEVEEIRSLPLWEEPLVLVVPRGHPLGANEPVNLATLRDYPVMVSGVTSGSRLPSEEARAALARFGISPMQNLSLSQPETLVGFVRSGRGIALTNLLAAAMCRLDGVEIVRIADHDAIRRVCFYWDATRTLSPAARALLDVAADHPVPDGATRWHGHDEDGAPSSPASGATPTRLACPAG